MKEKSEKVVAAEILIAWLLRIGVITSGVFIALGIVSRLLHIGRTSEGSRALLGQILKTQPVPGFHPIASPVDLMIGFAHWQPDIIITCGLLLLIALPIIRVALTIIIFLHERDWPFVAITAIVLTVLLSGIFLGRAL